MPCIRLGSPHCLSVCPGRPADLTITDALALGDKLLGVLQYHVSPGVVAPDALAKADSLPTLLGGDYRIGVSDAPDGKVGRSWAAVILGAAGRQGCCCCSWLGHTRAAKR